MQKMSEAMKRFALYLRTDFKEIVNPSAMPNPPWHKNPPAKSFPEKIKVVRLALREYGKGWRKFVTGKTPGEDQDRDEDKKKGRSEAGKEASSASGDDLAQAASELGQRGAETARPYLQRLYRTRMTSYREAITEFSAGFGEGLAQDSPQPPLPKTKRKKGETETDRDRLRQAERDRGRAS